MPPTSNLLVQTLKRCSFEATPSKNGPFEEGDAEAMISKGILGPLKEMAIVCCKMKLHE